jgi:hypothetical protein
MEARSPDLADALARALNGEHSAPQRVDDPSPLERYTVGRSPTKERWLIYAAASTGRDPNQFGDGVIAVAADVELARRAATWMNRVNPGRLRRGKFGLGWW